MNYPSTVKELTDMLRQGNYLADRGLATAVFVAMSLQRPILLEGEVGVGKTEIAKVLASVFDRQLIRLQCYEGIDTNQALYEWDYARQLLYIRALSDRDVGDEEALEKLFGPRFLLERPLMQAIQSGDQAVLLIDEVGTIKAEHPPLVVLTSNRTRDLHDALKRRCMYHWIGYPEPDREVEIVTVQAPEVSEGLARKVVAAVNRLREMDLAKPPGVAETIDWSRTLAFLGETGLSASAAEDTLGSIVKDRDDLELVRDNLKEVTSNA